jgi:hypothetical protein
MLAGQPANALGSRREGPTCWRFRLERRSKPRMSSALCGSGATYGVGLMTIRKLLEFLLFAAGLLQMA